MKMNTEHWLNDTHTEKPKHQERNLSQRHFTHHKTQMGWPGIESRPSRERSRRLTAGAMARRIPGLKLTCVIHSVVCLTTRPYPLPKRVLHRVRSSASSFIFKYLLFSLRSSSSCLRLLLRLAVIFILPSNFPQSRVLEDSF
jgi:hypothetical protein